MRAGGGLAPGLATGRPRPVNRWRGVVVASGGAPYRRRVDLPRLAVGLLQLLVAALIPVAVIWTLMHAGRLCERAASAARRLRPRRPEAAGPPVERLAADLRRLSAACRELPRGTSHARYRGMLAAYDDVLCSACRALDIEQSLGSLPPGLDRDLERLRVEGALESAGLLFRIPRKRQDTP